MHTAEVKHGAERFPRIQGGGANIKSEKSMDGVLGGSGNHLIGISGENNRLCKADLDKVCRLGEKRGLRPTGHCGAQARTALIHRPVGTLQGKCSAFDLEPTTERGPDSLQAHIKKTGGGDYGSIVSVHHGEPLVEVHTQLNYPQAAVE